MTYIYEYDIAAFFICAIILIMQGVRRGYPTKTRSLFNLLAFVAMLSSLGDVLTAFSIRYPWVEPLWLNHFIQIIYYLSQNLMVPVFTIFILVQINGRNPGKLYIRLANAVVIYDTAVILLSPFFGLAYRLDQDGNYSHGILFYSLYALGILLVLSIIPVFIKNRSTLLRFQRISLTVYMLVPLAALIVQSFYPHHLIFCLVCALTILMNYLALENPNEYIAADTECLNHKALNAYMDNHFFNESHFSVVAFSIETHTAFDRLTDSQFTGFFVNPLVKGLQDHFGYNNVFYLSKNHFAISMEKNTVWDDGRSATDFVRDLVKQVVSKNTENIEFPVHFFIIRYPETCRDQANFDMILDTFFNKHSASMGADSITNADDRAIIDRLRERQMISVLRDSLRTRSFSFFFQPILDLHTSTFRSAEVLIRFEDTVLGHVSPADFIHIAEHNGLINELGLMMFDELCSFLKRRQSELYGVDFIEFNLSIPHPFTEHIAGDYIAIMDKYDLPHHFFNFEVTEECASIVDKDMLAANLNEFKKAGVALSMDDFGTGYSNMMNILDLPFDLIKIDKSLLWKSMSVSNADLLLNDNIKMLRDMNKTILVEGVETQEMAAKVMNLGCDYIQGFLYSAPISPNAYLSFLAEHNLG